MFSARKVMMGSSGLAASVPVVVTFIGTTSASVSVGGTLTIATGGAFTGTVVAACVAFNPSTYLNSLSTSIDSDNFDSVLVEYVNNVSGSSISTAGRLEEKTGSFGSSISVTISGDSGTSEIAAALYRVENLLSTTPVDTLKADYSEARNTTSDVSGDISVSADGCVIAYGFSFNSTSHSWTGVNEQYDFDIRSGEYFSGGFVEATVSESSRALNVTCSTGGNAFILVAVSLR